MMDDAFDDIDDDSDDIFGNWRYGNNYRVAFFQKLNAINNFK